MGLEDSLDSGFALDWAEFTAFILFEDMMARIDNETIRYLFHVQIQQGEAPPPQRQPEPAHHAAPNAAAAAVASAAARAEEAPQRLPDFARALERRQERQQKDRSEEHTSELQSPKDLVC